MTQVSSPTPQVHPGALQTGALSLRFLLGILTVIALAQPRPASAEVVDVSSQVKVTHGGFMVNHATRVWGATMTVQNTGTSAITGPIQVVLTNLPAGVSMSNNTGMHNGSPYITVSTGDLAPGASVSVLIQFTNANRAPITFTPVTDSGTY